MDRKVRQLQLLLEEAAEKHHLFETNEQQLRNDSAWRDSAWPLWYARYIAARMEGNVIESTTGELGDYPDSPREGGYGHGV